MIRLTNIYKSLAFAFLVTFCIAKMTVAMPPQYYTVEDITLPKHVAPEVGGLAFNSKGELVVVLRRHGIIIGKPTSDPNNFEWRQFSNISLHNPMGILVESDSTFLIPQMAELTRISDTDDDGVADLFENVSTSFGLSGNYHETTCGPIPDGRGNWFLAVGTASHNGPVFYHTRGEYSQIGRRGRNYSSVPYRGWVIKVKPDGSVVPWASGFRANNGLTLSPNNDLWVTDNQGDWIGTSPIYHVQKDKFYGHPSSLIWTENWDSGDPLRLPISKLNNLRSKPAVMLPQGEMCNSPAEPIFDTNEGQFGPFSDQMFVGDIAGRRILRIILDKVNGTYQGACIKFIENSGLRGGNNRFIWSPNGQSLYVGQTYRGWGSPEEGLQRITYQHESPFEIHNIKITKTGFHISFTHSIDKNSFNSNDKFRIESFHYDYGHKYGSPKRNVKTIGVSSLAFPKDGKSIHLSLSELQPNKVYQISLNNVNSAKGLPLLHNTLFYTCNILP